MLRKTHSFVLCVCVCVSVCAHPCVCFVRCDFKVEPPWAHTESAESLNSVKAGRGYQKLVDQHHRDKEADWLAERFSCPVDVSASHKRSLSHNRLGPWTVAEFPHRTRETIWPDTLTGNVHIASFFSATQTRETDSQWEGVLIKRPPFPAPSEPEMSTMR